MSRKKESGNVVPKEKGGSSKLVSIIVTAVVVFLLMSGAVFIGYMVASKGNVSASETNSDRSSSNYVEKEATLELEEFLVNLSDEGKGMFLKVNMFLGSDEKNKKLQEEIPTKVPQIKDCINNILRTKKSTDITPEGEALLKEEIILKVNEVLSNGKIINVYFSSIIVQ